MPETLLRTKLTIPPLRPHLVERTKLIEKLNEGLSTEDARGQTQLFNRKLTLISAPAGFGKTTLVSSWIQQLEMPVAWLSLDEGDNKLNRFVYYTLAALQQVRSKLGKPVLALLQSPQSPPVETLLTVLINDLANLTDRLILVLDDYHTITDLDIHKAITFLLDNQPPQLHLVIISRSDPAFPLHRLRGSGQMRGIYVHDLRFTNAEAASFLNKTMGLSLSPEEIVTFERRTEGWVAGLQLAALSMQDMPNPSEFLASFAGDDRYISDYLIGEVFTRQPAQVQEFLLKTAILDQFSAPLCDAMLGAEVPGLGIGDPDSVPSSRTIIEQLDQSNLFIIPLDNKREWYRYHHLFADFLLLRLRQRPAEEIATLQRRAAAWHEDNGHLAEAINLSLAAGEFLRAGRLIEQNALATIFEYAQWVTLVDWVEAMPAEVVRSRPQLSLRYAWALFTIGRWDSVDPVLNDVIETIDTAEEKAIRSLKGEVNTLRAWLAFEIDEMRLCIGLAKEALELLPEEVLMIRSMAILAQGVARFWLGQLSISGPILEDALTTSLTAGNMAVALMAMGCQVHTEVRLGRLRKASELYKKARQQGAIEDIALLSPTGYACVQMGEVLRERGHLQEAKSLLREGIQLCRQAGSPEMAIEGQMTLARVLLAAGDKSGAAKQMAQAESDLLAWLGLGSNLQYSVIAPALVHRARYWIAGGELVKAARWLDENGIQIAEDLAPGNDERYVLLARVLIAQEQADEARYLLKQLRPLFENGEELRLRIETLVLTSISSQATEEGNLAFRSLSQALVLAEPEGYQRIFLDEEKSLTGLLNEVVRSGEEAAYARSILDAIYRERQSKIEAALQGASSPAEFTREFAELGLMEPLTEREQRILQLLAAELSNREIAAELFLSINTIKTYTSRIYGKLNVHNRAEAVDRAHQLGLL